MAKLFAIRDKKTGFENIFVNPNEGAAIRAFGEACKDVNSNLNKFPEDYELYKVGNWNQETGIIEPEQEKIATAEQYK